MKDPVPKIAAKVCPHISKTNQEENEDKEEEKVEDEKEKGCSLNPQSLKTAAFSTGSYSDCEV